MSLQRRWTTSRNSAAQLVAPVVFDARPAEHFVLDRAVAGHDIDAPTAAGDVVECRPNLARCSGCQGP